MPFGRQKVARSAPLVTPTSPPPSSCDDSRSATAPSESAVALVALTGPHPGLRLTQPIVGK
jgi:hypothetical protein